jgi:alpha-L-rhamnosidase
MPIRDNFLPHLPDFSGYMKDYPDELWPPKLPTLGQIMKKAGYKTAQFGKLEAGIPLSQGKMTKQGGTTIWERWDGYIEGRGFGHPKMNSFNHPALASVAAWVWRHIAGIQADETRPGFKHFFIEPKPGGGLTLVKAHFDSVRGRIESAWEIKDGKLTLRVTVPPNATAAVTLPNGETHRIESGSHEFSSHSKAKP